MATQTSRRKVVVPWEQAGVTLPERGYIFRVVDAEMGESKAGDPQVVLEYLVMAPKDFKGKKIKQFYTFNTMGLEQLRQAVTALLGSAPPKKASALNLDLLEGKLCKAEVQNSEGGGRTYSNLTNYESYGSAPEPEPEDDDGDDLDDEIPFDEEEEEDDDGIDLEDQLPEEEEEPAPRRKRRRRG